jgi:hypothetical protein
VLGLTVQLSWYPLFAEPGLAMSSQRETYLSEIPGLVGMVSAAALPAPASEKVDGFQ